MYIDTTIVYIKVFWMILLLVPFQLLSIIYTIENHLDKIPNCHVFPQYNKEQ